MAITPKSTVVSVSTTVATSTATMATATEATEKEERPTFLDTYYCRYCPCHRMWQLTFTTEQESTTYANYGYQGHTYHDTISEYTTILPGR